jgi:hypothetical protein
LYATGSHPASDASAELLAVKQIFIQEELDLGNDVSSLSLQRVQSWEQIERELDVLRQLQRHEHQNVVRFLGSGASQAAAVAVEVTLVLYTELLAAAWQSATVRQSTSSWSTFRRAH